MLFGALFYVNIIATAVVFLKAYPADDSQVRLWVSETRVIKKT